MIKLKELCFSGVTLSHQEFQIRNMVISTVGFLEESLCLRIRDESGHSLWSNPGSLDRIVRKVHSVRCQTVGGKIC